VYVGGRLDRVLDRAQAQEACAGVDYAPFRTWKRCRDSVNRAAPPPITFRRALNRPAAGVTILGAGRSRKSRDFGYKALLLLCRHSAGPFTAPG